MWGRPHEALRHQRRQFGDPYEIRTRVAGVRGRSLRPLDQRANSVSLCPFGFFSLVHHQGLEPGTP